MPERSRLSRLALRAKGTRSEIDSFARREADYGFAEAELAGHSFDGTLYLEAIDRRRSPLRGR